MSLINREKLIEELNSHLSSTGDFVYKEIIELITNAPTVQQGEPVAYDKNKIRSNVMSKAPAHFGVCDAIDLTMNEMGKLITTNAEQQRQEQGNNCCPECGCHFIGEFPFNYKTVQPQGQDEIIRKAVKDALEKAASICDKKSEDFRDFGEQFAARRVAELEAEILALIEEDNLDTTK